MSAPATPPIIIIKKKGGHGGHHGGAWKVAYADFVTAMMALFIVLWLLSSSNDVKKAIAGYFRDPKGYGKQIGSSMAGSGESLTITNSDMHLLKGKLEAAIKAAPQLEKLKPGARVVSHAVPIPGMKPDRVVKITSTDDDIERPLYLYTVPLVGEKAGDR